MVLAGHNVFFTGSTGCGKSTIVKTFVPELIRRGKRVAIIAPTNQAAYNIGARTVFNYACWMLDSFRKGITTLAAQARGTRAWSTFDSTDVLIIDEASMKENLVLERLNHIMKEARGEKYGGGPFGGVQLAVTGDVSIQVSCADSAS